MRWNLALMVNTQSNALILQSGGCTSVFNRSLFGIYHEALAAPEIGRILGARHGMEGLLKGDLVDLTAQSLTRVRQASHFPGAILGTKRHSANDGELDLALEVISKHGVRFLFIIGGNDSAETGNRISERIDAHGLDLSVMNVPKTIDNDLVLTDHTPGYGSAARFVALATLGTGMDTESMSKDAPITVMEVMGRDAGWLAAASVLVKGRDQDAPHVLGLPETPVEELRFMETIEQAYKRYGFAVAVVAENLRGVDGVLGEDDDPLYVDSFGHPYYDGPARYLARKLKERLNVRVRHQSPGVVQRSFLGAESSVDGDEAEMVGRAAVQAALAGRSGFMVTLECSSRSPYKCNTGLAPLQRVAGAVRSLPDEYIDRDRYFVNSGFIEYARPLIGDALPIPPRFE